jgi:rod shape-determining protein MreC
MYYYDEGRKKSFYYWIVLLLAIFILFNAPFVKRLKILHSVKVISSNVLFPFKWIAVGVYNKTTSGVYNFIRIKGIQKENNLLKNELKVYKARLGLQDELVFENQRLRNALYFRQTKGAVNFIPSEVIGRSGSNWFEMVEINRGANDRIVPDSAVINEEGLVGRVYEVSQFSSKVLLITDPTSAISIIDARTGDMGIASGNTIGPLKIRYLSSTADIRAGDKIITSGMSDIFSRGITVGIVKSADKKDYDIFQKVEVLPAVNFSRLDKVFIVIR